MDKTKLGKALSGGPIAEKIVAKMKRRMRSKIVNIRKVIESRTTAEELHKTAGESNSGMSVYCRRQSKAVWNISSSRHHTS